MDFAWRDRDVTPPLPGMATAPSIEGPWTRHRLMHPRWNGYNPTAIIHPDNSVFFALNGFNGRGAGVNKVKAWKAPHYSQWPLDQDGMGFIVDDPDVHPEDICLFYAGDGYGIIAHRYDKGEDSRNGIMFVSDDASGAAGTWKQADPLICYGPRIDFDDGTYIEVERRERPKVLQDEAGRVIYLYTAVYDRGKAWNIGVPVTPPYPDF